MNAALMADSDVMCGVLTEDRRGLALPLLVTRVRANDHDAAVATDRAALVADLLDARLNLHKPYSMS